MTPSLPSSGGQPHLKKTSSIPATLNPPQTTPTKLPAQREDNPSLALRASPTLTSLHPPPPTPSYPHPSNAPANPPLTPTPLTPSTSTPSALPRPRKPNPSLRRRELKTCPTTSSRQRTLSSPSRPSTGRLVASLRRGEQARG